MDGRIDYCELYSVRADHIYYYYYIYRYLRKISVVCVRHAMVTRASEPIYIYIHQLHYQIPIYSYNIYTCILYIICIYYLQKLSNCKNPPSSPQNPGHSFEANDIILGYMLHIRIQIHCNVDYLLKSIHEICGDTSQSTNYFSLKLQHIDT